MTEKLVESNVVYIGAVPSNWRVTKLKRVLNGSLCYGANEAAELEDRDLPRYIRITDFGDDGNLKDDTFKSLPEDVAADYLLEEGDVLFARSGATVGKTFIFKNYLGRACFAGYLIRAKPAKDKLCSEFLYYFTKSHAYEIWKNNIFTQATIQNIGADKYQYLQLPLPPKSEQEAIARHLDKVTAQIDNAIAIKQRQVEKLEEYWFNRLHEAVTKGLDEGVSFKFGNNSYLGNVPVNWKVDRLKDIAELNPPKPKIEANEVVSLVPMDCVSEDGRIAEVNGTTYEDVDKGLNYFEAGDVIFAKITPCMENGKGAFVNSLPSRYAFGSTEFFVLRPSGRVLGSYLYYATRTETFRKYAELNMKGAAGQQRVPSKFLATCEIAFPTDKQEQQAIVTYLDDLRSKVLGVQQRLTKQIDVLRAYRRSVIHEYVTGKKRVDMTTFLYEQTTP